MRDLILRSPTTSSFETPCCARLLRMRWWGVSKDEGAPER
jgi:hypothetical protein